MAFFSLLPLRALTFSSVRVRGAETSDQSSCVSTDDEKGSGQASKAIYRQAACLVLGLREEGAALIARGGVWGGLQHRINILLGTGQLMINVAELKPFFERQKVVAFLPINRELEFLT